MSEIIFLASTAYTGSTLISILMGSHPDIGTISELTGVAKTLEANGYPCSCGQPLVECQFFRDVAHGVQARGLKFSYQDFQTRFAYKNRFHRKLLYGPLGSDLLESARDSIGMVIPGHRQAVLKWRQYNRVMIQAILEVAKKGVFLDASKDYRRIPLLQKLFDEPLYVVHVTRDVRGYVNSCKKNRQLTIREAAHQWVNLHRDIYRISHRVNAYYKRIKYEDICRRTDSLIRDVYEFCHLRKDVDIICEPAKLHLIGNRVRLFPSLEVRLDESWKGELSRDERESAYAIGRELMNEFRYEH